MSERPTPETDALIYKTRAGISMFDHARKMERARDELREKYDTLATEHMLEVNKLCNERDEAREALENHMAATIHTCHDECKRPMCVLRRERDEAREELRKLKNTQ